MGSAVDVKSALVDAYLESESYTAMLPNSKPNQSGEGSSSQRGSVFGGFSSTTATGSSSTEGSLAGIGVSISTAHSKLMDTESTSGINDCATSGKKVIILIMLSYRFRRDLMFYD